MPEDAAAGAGVASVAAGGALRYFMKGASICFKVNFPFMATRKKQRVCQLVPEEALTYADVIHCLCYMRCVNARVVM